MESQAFAPRFGQSSQFSAMALEKASIFDRESAKLVNYVANTADEVQGFVFNFEVNLRLMAGFVFAHQSWLKIPDCSSSSLGIARPVGGGGFCCREACIQVRQIPSPKMQGDPPSIP